MSTEAGQAIRRILASDPGSECARCHATMSIPNGLEPSVICNGCAQEMVTSLLAFLGELDAATAQADTLAIAVQCYEKERSQVQELLERATILSDKLQSTVELVVQDERTPATSDVQFCRYNLEHEARKLELACDALRTPGLAQDRIDALAAAVFSATRRVNRTCRILLDAASEALRTRPGEDANG